MAKIYPERPPQFILDDPKRSSELKVYNALRGLPEKYTVFYNFHWLDHKDEIGTWEGEADFIVVHPNIGVLVIEVKGGGILYKPEKGQWYSQDRNGDFFEIKDPVEQGRRNHYEIKKQIEALPNWPNRELKIRHAVCFPGIYLDNRQFLKADLPREIVIDANDLDNISETIRRVFEFCFGEVSVSAAPGYDGFQVIEGFLCNSFEIHSPLGIELESEDERLIQLTEQQFWVLSILGDRKRAAIAGCAGSGKTMLAVKKARQFSDLGMQVLLVCFNIALAADLKQRLPQVDVYNFHELCKQAASQIGYPLQAIKDQKEFYDQVLPQILMDASQEIGRIYDAIIVDEGQDFQENYWIALESLLKEDGYLYIFYDNNQNLYKGSDDFGGLITEQPFVLTHNCRNTKSIHKTVVRFHNNPASLQCFGPDGRLPELISYNGEEDQQRTLQKLLYKLIAEEHIDHEDIVILTPRGEDRTRLKPGLKLGMFTLTNTNDRRQMTVQATSIYKFKGLERRVVILTEIDQRSSFNMDMVMYVGCSRARTHLIIMYDSSAPAEILGKLKTET
ncbi:MAG: NERD domain-containing protein [Bacteroidetes bacterium]|nr:NERD domain-containing protein [Bacteroidota bacterium]